VVDRLRHRLSRDEGGFTLVELLTVILITGFITSAIVGVVVSVGRAERVALDMTNNLDSARLASERVRDVVRASYAICNDSTTDTLRLWRDDTDNDRRVDADERTSISVAGGQLTRTDTGNPARVLATGVGPSSFVYLDEDGLEVAPPLGARAIDCSSGAEQQNRGDITTVSLTLSGDRAPGGRTPPTEVNSQISLRNAVLADGSIEPNRTPTATFVQNCNPPSCTFDAAASHDEDGTIAKYEWDFGGLGSGTGVTASFDFPLPFGSTPVSYPVTLTVTDNGGAVHWTTQFVTFDPEALTAAAEVSAACTGLTCTFSGAASRPVGGITSYSWELGDPAETTASGPSISHTYATSGSYAVTLTVTDTTGAVGSKTVIVNPNTAAGSVDVALTDVSTARNANTYYAVAQIIVTNTDGSPAVGVNVKGRFGGETAPLVAKDTNAQGIAVLQASGDYPRAATVPFTVVDVEGRTMSTTPMITLRYPS
jgi:PKD repeat protein/type II secretory pathway pseudopilin PulG